MSDRVAEWRTALGTSAALWSAGGRHEVQRDWWLAFSGANCVDYNAVLCHGPDCARGLVEHVAAVRAAKVPAVIMVAGAALAMTNALSGEGWVCVGARPFMALTDIGGEADPDVRRLRPNELADAQAMIGDAFAVEQQFAAVALPTVAATEPTREAWGLFVGGELVSCTAAVTVDDTLTIWSMATPPKQQRNGYGRRLLSAVLAHGREAGATTSLLYASPEGESLYRSIGYSVVEYWQVWSRARWIFPPA